MVINPIRSKMESYGDRLIRLVAEAYRDGIVLTVPEPEEGLLELPPPEGHEVFPISAAIPHMGRGHLSLQLPPKIVVKAVVKKDENGQPVELIPSFNIPLPT